jgi:peptide chain release factor subunit 1
MLAGELGAASHIKTRVNRQSVERALRSVQERLRLYRAVPPNGLVVCCGDVVDAAGRERQLVLHFEPPKPVRFSTYLCDRHFHVEALHEMLETRDHFGFLIVDGRGALLAEVCGARSTVLARLDVELPNKHGRGGQSARRFERLVTERRANYVRRVCEMANAHLLSGERVAVKALVLAGPGELKRRVAESPLLDARLRQVVVNMLDTAQGGENGLAHALAMSSDTLAGVKLREHREALADFFTEVARGRELFCYGLEHTRLALDAGAVNVLLVDEALDAVRCELEETRSGRVCHVFARTCEEALRVAVRRGAPGEQWRVAQGERLVDVLARERGAVLVNDSTPHGLQFARGFGGVGGVLAFAVAPPEEEEEEEQDADAEDKQAAERDASSDDGESREADASSAPPASAPAPVPAAPRPPPQRDVDGDFAAF